MGRLLIQFPGTNTTKALSETLSKNVIIVDEDLHKLRLHDGVTPGGHVIGGGGTTVIDDLTITKNMSDEIQTVGIVNKNTATGATNPIYDWVGTAAEYTAQSIATLHPDWLCFIIDKTSPALNHHVIEAQYPDASNGYTWYFLYSDGWVEMGGKAITNGDSPTLITLPVEVADTNYVPLIQGRTAADGYSNATWQVMPVNTVTSPQSTTGFYAQASITGYNLEFVWHVEAMAA